MSYTTHGHVLDVDDFRDYSNKWQRCLAEDMADLFYAYDTQAFETERITSFRISGDTLTDVVTAIDAAGTGFRLLIHLGLKPGYRDLEEIPSKPFFLPILQVVAKKGDVYAFENGFAPDWDPNPDITTSVAASVNSGVDEIPGEAAYLFVQAWLETPHVELSDCFESVSYNLNRRVKCYTFSESESYYIGEKIKDKSGSNNGGQFSIHLGKGMTVSTHPFSFRPVVEVAAVSAKGIAKLGENGNGYYDYSQPSPPFPAGGGGGD